MQKRLNCWEFHDCGRMEGGKKVHAYGVCPATNQKKADGIHGGKNGGRACWVIAGTFCGGKIQGTFADKYKNCLDCGFYNQVLKDCNFALNSVDDILRQIGEH